MIVKDKETGEIYESFLENLMPYECWPTQEEADTFREWLDAQDQAA